MALLYTSTQLIATTYYSENFDYGLSNQMANNRQLANSRNFMQSKNILRINIDSSNTAVSEMQDIYASQRCLDNCKYLMDNTNLFS